MNNPLAPAVQIIAEREFGAVEGRQLVNSYSTSGLFVGVILGFFLGRTWAEYFRARAVGQQTMWDRRNYRGRTAAWFAGAILIVGGALLFAYLVPA